MPGRTAAGPVDGALNPSHKCLMARQLGPRELALRAAREEKMRDGGEKRRAVTVREVAFAGAKLVDAFSAALSEPREFIAPKAKRGRPRIEDRGKPKPKSPWELAGMSRASWYRRKSK